MYPNTTIPDPNPTDSTARTTNEELSLCCALLDGHIEQFNFRGLNVVVNHAHIVVMDGDMLERLGGAYKPATFDAAPLYEWLVNKALEYDDEVAMEAL